MAMLHLKAKNSECKSIRNFLYIKVLLMLSFSVLCKKSRRGRYKVRGDILLYSNYFLSRSNFYLAKFTFAFVSGI